MSPTKRKSNRELQLAGSHQNADEEVVQPGIPDPPETLTDEERLVWDDTTELLFQASRLTKLDGGSIHAYCRAVCLWDKAFDDLQVAGPYQETASGTKKLSAELSNYNACDRTYERWCVQLGFSPKSRPMATVQAGEGAGEDDLNKVLAGDDPPLSPEEREAENAASNAASLANYQKITAKVAIEKRDHPDWWNASGGLTEAGMRAKGHIK
jgi:P27 family predicted phage terminase small subunit